MKNAVKNLLQPKVRKYVYGLATTGLAVAVAYGLVDGGQADYWQALVAAVTGLAFLNTDTASRGDDPEA